MIAILEIMAKEFHEENINEIINNYRMQDMSLTDLHIYFVTIIYSIYIIILLHIMLAVRDVLTSNYGKITSHR